MSKRPHYETLRKYRVLPIAIILYLIYVNERLLGYTFENIKDLQEWQLSPLVAGFVSITGGLIALAKLILNKIEDDDDASNT